ncbi:retrovirus-related Pol polyprotein from transposon 17.6 [Trichonephila clavipes]|nr:retrovirus-related Pol polyprotein from transposon 17.6 [Trichonephila clavipes]
MTPVDLPYVPILLNETFITDLWDTGAEKSFISEEVYRRYFSYRPRQKTKDRVVTAKGIDFMKESQLTVDCDKKSLIIPHDQIKQLPKVEKPVEIDLSDTKLGEGQKQKLKDLFNSFKGLFLDHPGLTHVLYQEIDTGDQYRYPVIAVASRPYRYDRVKQGIIDYHIEKMLQEGKIRPTQSPYASPVVLTRKNNGFPLEAYRFAIDYRKLNAITKYPRYPLPVIDDLITNIPHIGIMSTLDLKSGYFQLAISPKDIEKTAFITRNGTVAFLRMPFGLSGAVPNFQKAIDIILKSVIGRFVMFYMDDVIITSPSFNKHIDNLNQVFTLLRDAGLTLNKDKYHFALVEKEKEVMIHFSARLHSTFANHLIDLQSYMVIIKISFMFPPRLFLYDPPWPHGRELKRPPVGVVVRRGGAAGVVHVTMVQNYVVRRQKPSLAEQCDVNIQSINQSIKPIFYAFAFRLKL